MKTGKVYIVGAGPGDPALITVKALDCLRQAKVVLHDRLLDEHILEIIPRGAEKIYVGKSSSLHTFEQEEINQLLVKKARAGKIVVRLKGGDPFVFGRGAEEAEVLAKNSIPFEIVPGVSSVIAVPAYAGIPLTHRCIASSFTVVSGHPAKNGNSVDWSRIAGTPGTLVIVMTADNIEDVVRCLLNGGKAAVTPAAVISRGTSTAQKTLAGSLGDIVARCQHSKLEPPAILIIGEVVKFRDNLRWFDNTPLFGKRILISRQKSRINQFSRMLLARGAIPIEMPVIKIVPYFKELDNAISNINKYSWLVFTSSNGVEAFFQRLKWAGFDGRKLAHLKIAAIGKASSQALAKHGIIADCAPKIYTSKNLAACMERQDISDSRILLPRSDIADEKLAKLLELSGAVVDKITAYKTVQDRSSIYRGKKMLLEHKVDAIMFTSSSTVKNLLETMRGKKILLNNSVIACIGPVTASIARKSGLHVDVVSREHTVAGLLEAVERYLQKES